MPSDSTPYGYCKCGCGRKTSIASRNEYRRGHTKGEPIPFIPGHSGRNPDFSYSVDDNGCWIPQKKPNNVGYVYFFVNGKQVPAHRYMWESNNGSIPPGKEPDHLCRNRSCCNPDHLELVTRAVNIQRGSRSKLNPEIVRRMRELHSSGRTCSSIAREFGVNRMTAWFAIKGKTWVNV